MAKKQQKQQQQKSGPLLSALPGDTPVVNNALLSREIYWDWSNIDQFQLTP